MDGLSEKVPSCFQHFSEQDAKDARNQTTVTGSTTRARGVAFFSVVGTPGGRQPIPSLDPSESFPLLTKILTFLGPAPGLRKVQMGRPCSMVMEVETKVLSLTSLFNINAALSKFATHRLLSTIRGIDLGNCRLRILALPAVIQQYLTSRNHWIFDIV